MCSARTLFPVSCDLANGRFAIIADVGKSILDASHFSYAPTRICTLLLQVRRARLCGSRGLRHQILTGWGKVLQMLLDTACDPTSARLHAELWAKVGDGMKG